MSKLLFQIVRLFGTKKERERQPERLVVAISSHNWNVARLQWNPTFSLRWPLVNVRTVMGYNLMEYTKSPRAVACHVYRSLFLRSRYIGRRGADGVFNAARISRRCSGSQGGKRVKRGNVGGGGGDGDEGAGKSAGVSSCRGGSRNLLAPDALSRGASL